MKCRQHVWEPKNVVSKCIHIVGYLRCKDEMQKSRVTKLGFASLLKALRNAFILFYFKRRILFFMLEVV
jgi:hypothetical protein